MRISPRDIDVLVLSQSQPDGKAVASMPARALPEQLPVPAMTAVEANRRERAR